MMYQLGFIGTGSMGGALVMAAANGGHGAQCLLSNRTRAKAQALADRFGCAVADSNEEVARRCRYILLGVKPYKMAETLAGISHVLDERREAGEEFTLVSMAAGLTIKSLQGMAGGAYPVVRILPNTPCAIGKGMVLVTPGDGVTEKQMQDLCGLLQAAGRFDAVEEGLMDAGGVIAGCTPAWAYLFLEGLADGAVEAGVPRDKAMAYAAQAVLGAAAMCLEPGAHPGPLKDAVCSPGGSTIAGVHALERAGLRGAAMDAVNAAFDKTKELGKG